MGYWKRVIDFHVRIYKKYPIGEGGFKRAIVVCSTTVEASLSILHSGHLEKAAMNLRGTPLSVTLWRAALDGCRWYCPAGGPFDTRVCGAGRAQPSVRSAAFCS